MNYDSKNKTHMVQLASRLVNVKPSDETLVASFLLDQGLMKIQLLYQLLLKVVKWRRGTSIGGWYILERQTPGTIKEYLLGAANHITSGEDKTSKDSAGGFNQREVDVLTRFLDNLYPPKSP